MLRIHNCVVICCIPLNFSAAFGSFLFLSGWDLSASFLYAFLISS